MFFVIRFLLVWTLWLVFADKKRWRELFPVGIFAGLLGATTDNIMTDYTLWKFQDHMNWDSWIFKVMDDWGMYIVCPYLFIQWLPKERQILRMIGYWFVWTAICMVVEWIHVATGHMTYHKWWGYGWSYLADWILLSLLFLYHKVFRLREAFQYCRHSRHADR